MISLRKINSLLVIVVILLLVNHAILALLNMYGIIDYYLDIKITGRRLFYPVVAHIIISLYLYFSDKVKQDRIYSDLISETTMQIVSGILIIVFAALHILSYMFISAISKNFSFIMIHLTIDTLLFISLALHLRVSIPRFMVSLGLLEGKDSYGNFKKKMNIVILFVLILCVTTEIIWYIGGVI